MSPVKPRAASVKPPKSAYYEVRRSRIQGRGAFAVQPIPRGRRIDEYLGQPISHEEADRRAAAATGRHHTFLFVLDDTTVIDARIGGSDARFINHSCAPNCESVIIGRHIYIKSIKAIAPETELTYDYRYEWDDSYGAKEVREYLCRCNAPTCRGTILRVPRYLKETVAAWLAGRNVRKPAKPVRVRKGATQAEKKVANTAVKKRTTTRTTSRVGR